METLTGKINVEEFRSWLTRQKTITERFKWNCSTQDAFDMLLAAYHREVELRGMVCEIPGKVYDYLNVIAETLTMPTTKRGILLCGNCGNGKTTSMNAFLSVSKYLEVVRRRTLMAEGEVPKGMAINATSARRLTQVAKDEVAMNEAKLSHVLCIDDVGLEPTEVLDFGNAINPVIEILEHRYRNQLFTFITTNLTPKQIREKYGDRIADRFNEIMKCIVYDNPTFRK